MSQISEAEWWEKEKRGLYGITYNDVICDHYTADLSEDEWEAHMEEHVRELKREIRSLNNNSLLATDALYQ